MAATRMDNTRSRGKRSRGATMRLAGLALTVTALLLAGASSVAAEETDGAEARHARIEHSLMGSIMSPFCPGKTIEACPSPRAEEWRRDIRQWVSEGVDGETVRERLQARAPDFDIAGRPGVSWDWSLPLLAMAAATLWLLVLTRRLRRRAPETSTREPDAAHDALDERLDRELAEGER